MAARAVWSKIAVIAVFVLRASTGCGDPSDAPEDATDAGSFLPERDATDLDASRADDVSVHDDGQDDATAGESSVDARVMDADPNDAGRPFAHLYASDRAGGSVARFDIVAGRVEATPSGSFASAAATGLAFGPTGILFVGNRAAGTVARFADVAGAPIALTPLPAPSVDAWRPTGLLFVARPEGGGELWVGSEVIVNTLVVYRLDAQGALVGSPVAVPTGLTVNAGTHGIQGLAYDEPSSSLFVAVEQLRRLKLTRETEGFRLTEVVDPALLQPGAQSPVGLVMAPNRWLFAAYPTPSSLQFGYWAVTDDASTYVNGTRSSGPTSTFSPLGLALLPGHGAAPPIDVYASSQRANVLVLQASVNGVPDVGRTVCAASPAAWIAIGE